MIGHMDEGEKTDVTVQRQLSWVNTSNNDAKDAYAAPD